MTLLHQHALEFEDYVQNATLFIHPLPSLLLKPSLQLLYLVLRLLWWIHRPTGTNESLPPKLSTAQFEKNYPGEVLDAHSTPSVRLWSLVHQQKVNKAIKYIPIQLRLSEHQCSGMIETRSSKPLRSEIQLLSQLCWDDTPEMDINSVRFFRDWFNRTPTPQFSGMHMYYVVCVTYKYSKLSTPRLQNTPLFNSIKSWGWGTQSLKNSSVLTRRFGVLSHSCIRMALGLSKNASTRWLLSDLTYHHYFNHVLEYQKHYLRHGMARAKVEKAKEEKAQEEKARPNHTSSTRGISVPMDSTTTIKLHYVWNIMLVSASVTTVTTSMRAQFAFKADDHVCKTTQQRLTKDPPDSVITTPIYRPQTITYTVTNQVSTYRYFNRSPHYRRSFTYLTTSDPYFSSPPRYHYNSWFNRCSLTLFFSWSEFSTTSNYWHISLQAAPQNYSNFHIYTSYTTNQVIFWIFLPDTQLHFRVQPKPMLIIFPLLALSSTLLVIFWMMTFSKTFWSWLIQVLWGQFGLPLPAAFTHHLEKMMVDHLHLDPRIS